MPVQPTVQQSAPTAPPANRRRRGVPVRQGSAQVHKVASYLLGIPDSRREVHLARIHAVNPVMHGLLVRDIQARLTPTTPPVTVAENKERVCQLNKCQSAQQTPS